MKKLNGFSLVEVLVVMGILSFLIAGGFFIGLPEYNRFVVYSERDQLIDTFLEGRVRSLASGEVFVVSTWTNGYCLKNVSGLCVEPIHDLPSNMSLTTIVFSTSTKVIIALDEDSSGGTLQSEINIDQNGFIIW